MSDISGQDIISHGDDPSLAIRAIRDWLANSQRTGEDKLPGSSAIVARYRDFIRDLPELCDRVEWDPTDLTFTDHAEAVSDWMKRANAREER